MEQQLDKKSILEMAECALVPTEPVTTSLFITSKASTGEMVVAEMVPQVPGQMGMDGREQNAPKILKFQKQA